MCWRGIGGLLPSVQVHAPPEQVLPPVHGVLHTPQWRESVSVFVSQLPSVVSQLAQPARQNGQQGGTQTRIAAVLGREEDGGLPGGMQQTPSTPAAYTIPRTQLAHCWPACQTASHPPALHVQLPPSLLHVPWTQSSTLHRGSGGSPASVRPPASTAQDKQPSPPQPHVLQQVVFKMQAPLHSFSSAPRRGAGARAGFRPRRQQRAELPAGRTRCAVMPAT